VEIDSSPFKDFAIHLLLEDEWIEFYDLRIKVSSSLQYNLLYWIIRNGVLQFARPRWRGVLWSLCKETRCLTAIKFTRWDVHCTQLQSNGSNVDPLWRMIAVQYRGQGLNSIGSCVHRALTISNEPTVWLIQKIRLSHSNRVRGWSLKRACLPALLRLFLYSF